MSVSEHKKRTNSKHDKDNWQYITFKARAGSKDRIVEAAQVTGLSINGFIREAVSKAVMDAINKPLELTHEEVAKVMYLRILDEELNKAGTFGTMSLRPFKLDATIKNEVRENLANSAENNPSIYKNISRVLSADLPPKTKGKAIRDTEKETRSNIMSNIIDLFNNYPTQEPDFLKKYFRNNPE